MQFGHCQVLGGGFKPEHNRQKGGLRIAKNYWGITLTFHNGQNLQCSATQLYWTWNQEKSQEEPKWLSEKSIHDISNFDDPSNLRRGSCKKPWGNLFGDFAKAFDSIHREKMEPILLAYGLPKETVAAIIEEINFCHLALLLKLKFHSCSKFRNTPHNPVV